MIYICHTVYHVLISLLKVDKQNNNIIVINFDNFKYKISDNLKKFFNTDIIHVSNDEFYEFLRCNHNKEIYIYNDCTTIGRILRNKKLYYNIIEDSYDYFTYNTQFSTMRVRTRILMKIFRNYSCLGYSKYVKTIEVNDKNKVFRDVRLKKMIECSRKNLFLNANEERKRVILNLFSIREDIFDVKRSVLILTQPLYQDSFDKEIINSENDQIKYYKSIVDKYKNEYSIYFKVHPRDNINYASLNFDNVIFLDKGVPMELYEFVGDYKFDIGITHSSTALDYLSCVKEKIFLKDLRR